MNADELLLDAVAVPGDPSSAAFLIAAGVLVPASRLLLADVGVNWTRTGFLRILRRMRGIVLGDLEDELEELTPEEPVSDLDVAHGALEATVVEAEEVPLAIDELPLVALLGCFAEGETVVRGAQELRVKESDRIAGVVEGLRGLGAEIEATEDGFAVTRHRRAAGRHDRQPRRSPPGDDGRGRRARLAGGRRGDRHGGRRGLLPGLPRGPREPRRESLIVLRVRIRIDAGTYPTIAHAPVLQRVSTGVVIAIDGPAGAGKSTVARGLAEALGFTYLDSGAMYRSVALLSLRNPDGDPAELAAGARIELGGPGGAVLLDGEDVSAAIRTPEVSAQASVIAAQPAVREALVTKQRALLAAGDWVAEGRDIGTVVAPGAELKVYLDADPAERARRRAAELGADPRSVLAEQTLRDERDRGREASPLRAADGAVTLDTTGLGVEEVVARIAQLAGPSG